MFYLLGWRSLIFVVPCVGREHPGGRASHLAITLCICTCSVSKRVCECPACRPGIADRREGPAAKWVFFSPGLSRIILYRLIFLYIQSLPIYRIDTVYAFPKRQWLPSPDPPVIDYDAPVWSWAAPIAYETPRACPWQCLLVYKGGYPVTNIDYLRGALVRHRERHWGAFMWL